MWLVLWLFLCSFLSPSLNFNHVQNTPTNKIFHKALEWYPAIKTRCDQEPISRLLVWERRTQLSNDPIFKVFFRFFPSIVNDLALTLLFLPAHLSWCPIYVCYYKALDSNTRTTTRTTFIFKFSRLFSKNRHPGESIIILYLFFSPQTLVRLFPLKELEPFPHRYK